MKSKVLARLSKLIKFNDKFAMPILLNYKGETSYKTVIGGLTSITISAIIICYSWVLFGTVVNRQNSAINSNEKIRTLMLDPSKFNLGDYRFMFTLYEASYNPNFYRLLDPSYLKLSMYQTKQSKSNPGPGLPIGDARNVPFKLWDDDRFDSLFTDSSVSKFESNYTICPNTTDLFVGGNYFSSEYNFFYIGIEKWTNETYWK